MNEERLAATLFIETLREQAPPSGRGQAVERLRRLLARCAELLGCEGGSVWLVQNDGDVACLLALDNAHIRLKGFRLAPGEGVAGFCLETGRPFSLENAPDHQRHSPRVDRLLHSKTRQLLTCPLIAQGRRIGVMSMLNRRPGLPSFCADSIQIAQMFAWAAADLIVAGGIWPPGRARQDVSQQPAASTWRIDDLAHPVGVSPTMQDVMTRIRSSRDRNLLLTGETGVGKDHLAHWAHRIGSHAGGEFVVIDCPAIQPELWESELFGHARGAFTSAIRDKPGRIEEAHDGTLFLNEIGELPMPMQAKLLVFLDTGRFQRVGESKVRRVRARIIAATNRDLTAEIAAGRFRRDLYYRLAAVHICIPPLRERQADIIALAMIHLERLARAHGVAAPWLSDETRALLMRCRWNGNTRELITAVETAFLRCIDDGEQMLRPGHFGDLAQEAAEPEPPAEAPEEREHLLGRLINELEHRLTPARDKISRTGGEEILADPARLKKYLDQYRFASSPGWNLSAAWRALIAEGRLKISQRTFARHVARVLGE
ncbi:sigma 54-interacting transcriptional regulator [bacterium]|nr:sigma 54-interacting transcriptional regulator [bacterium]